MKLHQKLIIITTITLDKIRNCMKNRKTVGPDDILIEVWKSLGSLGVLMLTDLSVAKFHYPTLIHKGRSSVYGRHFALRTLMEAYREKWRTLHVAFSHLQKAYDCVSRQCI